MHARSLLPLALAWLCVECTDDKMNPIRKVVNLLQAMQKKVMAEGEKEKELFGKMSCFCSKNDGELSSSINAAEIKVPAVSSDIKGSEEKLSQTKADLKTAQTDRANAKKDVEDATALRAKEAAAYAKEKAEADTNIAAIDKAVNALEKGMAGGFLQTESAKVLRRLALDKQEMLDADRQELIAFLSGTQSSGYAPASGEITGILKELGDTMKKNRADLVAQETEAIKSFQELTSAKAKEIEALVASIESKTRQIGDLGVAIVQMKDDLSDTETALEQDRQYLADLKKSCATKNTEYEQRTKTRNDELVAISDTIKILNDDDALELFKKTLPSSSASFMQMASSREDVRARALTALRHAQGVAIPQDRTGLGFLALALSGKKALSKGGFEKVIKMIDDMVAILKQEQQDDDDKKEYCGLQLDQSEDKKKAMDVALEDNEHAIATVTETLSTLKEEMKSLEEGIKALDKSVLDATVQRKAENAEFKELVASNRAAKELLSIAKNRLNQFYNPKLYKAPEATKMGEQTSIAVAMGSESAPTVAPSGIAGTGVTVFAQISEHKIRQEPLPETWSGEYKNKSQETGGVISMLDLLIKDLDKETTEAETEEKNSQKDYEQMMTESSKKRSTDSKSLAGKGSALASAESQMVSLQERKKSAGSELMALTKYIASLHSECDWLLQYHTVRKDARAGEVDSLQKAKAVLSGADFAMLQTKSQGFLRK